jgi:hypothetical protein
MPIPSALVTRYFQLIVERQITEAERELEKLKGKMHKTEWNRGYFRALYGMLLARKNNHNNDSYAFFSKLDFRDKEAMNNYRREFLDHMRNGLHGDFDRGYFAAWAECMRVLSKLTIDIPETKNNESDDEKTKIVETDKEQTTIESFSEENA